MFERTKQGAVDIIRGSDPLDREHTEFLLGLFAHCGENGQPRVVLDFQGVPLLDSAGLELLLDTQDDFQQLGGALKLSAPNDLCSEILKVTGVGSRFEIYPDSAAAVGSFAR